MSESKQSSVFNDSWQDLIVAILAVNQYSLEKTYALAKGITEEGLSNPNNLKNWDTFEIASRLRKAGCERGDFMTALFANRLAALGGYIKEQGVDQFEKILVSQDPKKIEEFLLPVNGIGPKVLDNLFLLMGIKK